MRGAFGKPTGTAARVEMGQILISVRCREKDIATVVEGLRRAKAKFAGKQRVVVSKKWGFTDLTRDEYLKLRAEGRLEYRGVHVKVLTGRGPIAAN